MLPGIAKAGYIRRKVRQSGQTTSYGGNPDDGAIRSGKAKGPYLLLNTGQYAGITLMTINGKVYPHTNNCVLDVGSGLMWSASPISGSTATLLPWTQSGGDGIFVFVSGSNSYGLAGYKDWRIPNVEEMLDIYKFEPQSALFLPDLLFFPGYAWINSTWCSTTDPTNSANAIRITASNAQIAPIVKTTALFCLLVRGGN